MRLHRSYGGCHGDITALDWSADSSWIAVAAKDLCARCCHPITCALTAVHGTKASVFSQCSSELSSQNQTWRCPRSALVNAWIPGVNLRAPIAPPAGPQCCLSCRVFSLNPIDGYKPPTLAGHRDVPVAVFFTGPRPAPPMHPSPALHAGTPCTDRSSALCLLPSWCHARRVPVSSMLMASDMRQVLPWSPEPGPVERRHPPCSPSRATVLSSCGTSPSLQARR